jgi:hypothetical protein
MHKSTPPNADCITKTLISRSCGTIEREMYSGRTFYTSSSSNKICNSKLVEFVMCEVFVKNTFTKSGRASRYLIFETKRFCWRAHFVCVRRHARSNCKWQKLIKIPAKCVYNKVTLAPGAPSPY